VRFLRAAADYTGVCYLRGSSYSGFDGRSWFRQDAERWPEEVLFPYLNAELESHSIRVETEEEEKLLYSAYETLRMPEGGSPEGDSWYRNLNGTRGYTLRVCLDPGGAAPMRFPDYEQWVLENCTALPPETRTNLLRWWEARGGMRSTESPGAKKSCLPQVTFRPWSTTHSSSHSG
jgi:hypothetical protein